MMMEPTLENIEDYNTLKGQKKKVVWAVVLSGLILGAVYVITANIYDTPQGSIDVKEKVGRIPLQ
jgi:hypothetical protein